MLKTVKSPKFSLRRAKRARYAARLGKSNVPTAEIKRAVRILAKDDRFLLKRALRAQDDFCLLSA
jgi:hypothetical protein